MATIEVYLTIFEEHQLWGISHAHDTADTPLKLTVSRGDVILSLDCGGHSSQFTTQVKASLGASREQGDEEGLVLPVVADVLLELGLQDELQIIITEGDDVVLVAWQIENLGLLSDMFVHTVSRH